VLLLFHSESESYILQGIQITLLPANIYHKIFEDRGKKLKGHRKQILTLANVGKALSGQFSTKPVLLNDNSIIVPDSVPDTENFSSQLIVCLGIKNLNNAQAETVINNTKSK